MERKGKKDSRTERRSKRAEFGIDAEMIFLFLLMTRKAEVASAAPEDIQNREERMENGQWKKDIAGHG